MFTMKFPAYTAAVYVHFWICTGSSSELVLGSVLEKNAWCVGEGSAGLLLLSRFLLPAVLMEGQDD